MLRSPASTLKRARRLRRTMTDPEVMLWSRLKGRDKGRPVFRRQYALGPYILDFYCPAARLVIEVDGAYHSEDARIIKDLARDGWLEARGLKVIRIAAGQVFARPDDVADGIVVTAIERALQLRPTIAGCAEAEGPLHRASRGPPPP